MKQSIQEKIRIVKENIVSYKLLTQPIAPDNAVGRISRMEAINSKSINDAAMARAKTTLSQLKRALIRVDLPDYGLCRECEEPIPMARLMILPEADFCVRCAGQTS